MTPPKDEGFIPKIKLNPTMTPGEYRLVKDEAKMSNRKRAKNLSSSISFHFDERFDSSDRAEVDAAIERALDAKDAEWKEKLNEILIGMQKAQKAQFILGQKEMRERAAKRLSEPFMADDECDACGYIPKEIVAQELRALPIEGE